MPEVHIERQVTVEGDRHTAYQGWLQYVWEDGGGLGAATIIKQSDTEDSCIGMQRKVGGGIVEEITDAKQDELIAYSVVKGPFPVSEHNAWVHFETIDDKTTRIVWKCTIVPYWGLSWFLQWMVGTVFAKMLNHLQSCLATADK
eukprot:m.2974 g.2974  ORF g.2974 m.2974 type:complete len:144 (+) comp4239_c0_seq2:74-505(+)